MSVLTRGSKIPCIPSTLVTHGLERRWIYIRSTYGGHMAKEAGGTEPWC